MKKRNLKVLIQDIEKALAELNQFILTLVHIV